jgi:hypothetical protein
MKTKTRSKKPVFSEETANYLRALDAQGLDNYSNGWRLPIVPSRKNRSELLKAINSGKLPHPPS